jgi:hypothetical protein
MCSIATLSPNIDCAVKLKILDRCFFSIIDSESDNAKQTLFRRRELIMPFNKCGWAWRSWWILKRHDGVRCVHKTSSNISRDCLSWDQKWHMQTLDSQAGKLQLED